MKKTINEKKIAALVREILIELGEAPGREGLKKTPERVAKAMSYLTQGYRQDIKKVVNRAVFTSQYDQMVVLRDIEVYSVCEHHMMPFYGKCHVCYIAQNKVLGVSKLARIVDMYARRLQIQERLTEQIAQAIQKETGALGVAVVMECQHLCMMMRGVEKQNARMTTSAVSGALRKNPAARQEFLSLLGGGGKV